MDNQEDPETIGIVLDESLTYTVGDFSRTCGLRSEELYEMVQEGLLQPTGASPAEWRFTAVEITRVHAAQRLRRDLGVNLAGAALALDLHDEVNDLRARLRVLEKLLED